MRSFSLFFFLGAILSFGLLASANPVEAGLVKRDNADIASVFNTLKGQTDTILPQIKALTSAGNVSETDVAPLLTQLTNALNTASGSLALLPVSDLRKRQSDDELASLVAGIVNDIVDAVQGLVAELSTIPLLAGLLAGVDGALNQVLLGLGILLKGVLRLVAALLVNVAALLRDLAFDLTLGTLGF